MNATSPTKKEKQTKTRKKLKNVKNSKSFFLNYCSDFWWYVVKWKQAKCVRSRPPQLRGSTKVGITMDPSSPGKGAPQGSTKGGVKSTPIGSAGMQQLHRLGSAAAAASAHRRHSSFVASQVRYTYCTSVFDVFFKLFYLDIREKLKTEEKTLWEKFKHPNVGTYFWISDVFLKQVKRSFTNTSREY